MRFEDKRFSNIIKRLIEFKSSTTTIPIKDVSWEELIWATFVFMYGDNSVCWDSQSHEKSIDIKVTINNKVLSLSAKGGIIKRHNLTLSSYRLTSFDSLQDKLCFIENQHRRFNFYLICAREIDRVTKSINYLVVKAPSEKLVPAGMLDAKNWQRNKNNYELKNGFGLNAKIVFKMSNQLWYSIPLDYFSEAEKLVKISIPKRDLGSGLIDFLRRNQDNL